MDTEVKLSSELLKAKVQLSLLYTSGISGIRVSLHYDDTAEDLQALLEVVRHAMSASRVTYSKQFLCSPQVKEDLNEN
jgi:hypothetical protein